MELHLGQVLAFADDPFHAPVEVAARVDRHGALAVADGKIVAVESADSLTQTYPRARIVDHGAHLLSPGFVDAHMHYPQTAIIASWGKRLIDWLNDYTFPEEMRLADPAYAAQIAGRSLDLALAHGTTTLCSYATIHPQSVDAFFEAAEARGMGVLTGKTCMDRNAPPGLRDTAQSAYDDSKALADRWDGRGRAQYVITPRFSPTSTPDQLAALGALAAERPNLRIQTHISEQREEVAWVSELFPQARDYLDTYDMFGLLRQGALMGHAIWLTPRERDRLREIGAALIHCPTSNTFIGSGLFDTAARKAEGQQVALATDTGGGSSFSMLRSMAAAYEIGQLTGHALHPAQLWWLATEGSAQALGLTGSVGRLAPGAWADFIAVDLASTPAIAQRHAQAETAWEALFPTVMMGDDRAIAGTWVQGQRVKG